MAQTMAFRTRGSFGRSNIKIEIRSRFASADRNTCNRSIHACFLPASFTYLPMMANKRLQSFCGESRMAVIPQSSWTRLVLVPKTYEDNKNEFVEPRANRLVGVDRWRRPPDEDDPDWNITLPFRGFLYKVAKKQIVVKKKRKTTHIIVYVLDEIDEGAEVDFTMDLRRMVREFESKIAPKGLPVEMIRESDGD